MRTRFKNPTKWVYDLVIEPMIGLDGMCNCSSTPEPESLIGKINALSERVHWMATDAQYANLHHLKRIGRILRETSKEWDEAVEYAEHRAEKYKERHDMPKTEIS